MKIEEKGPSFTGSEKTYFEWSNQVPPPDVWQYVEKPAMTAGIIEAINQLSLQDIRVLDIGVGGGKVLGLHRDLGRQDSDLVGIDINPELIKLVRGLYPRVDLRAADISDPSVLSNLSDKSPFQLITLHMVCNHLNDEQLSVSLSNIFNLLSDGGVLVGLVPYPNNPAKLGTLIDSSTGYYSLEEVPWGGQTTHRHRSFVEYQEYLELTGFLPHLTAFKADTSLKPNRLLFVGKKSSTFKNSLENNDLGTDDIDKHNYLPNR